MKTFKLTQSNYRYQSPPVHTLTDREFCSGGNGGLPIADSAGVSARVGHLQAAELEEGLLEQPVTTSQVFFIDGHQGRVGNDLVISAPSDVHIRLTKPNTHQYSCLPSNHRGVAGNNCQLQYTLCQRREIWRAEC